MRKWILLSIGLLCVGLAVAGLFIPLLPTTPFLLLAAACFMRSSDRLYQWLVTHRWFGPYIRNYYEHRAVTRQAKVAILLLLWGTLGYTSFTIIDSLALRALLMLVGSGVTVHVLTMRTLTEDMLSRGSEGDSGGFGDSRNGEDLRGF